MPAALLASVVAFALIAYVAGVYVAGSPACPAPGASEASASPPASLPGAGGWSPGVPLPAARAETVAAVVDGRLFVLGGLDAGRAENGTCGRSLGSTVVFDPARGRWGEAAPLPGPRSHPAVAAWDGRIYVSGGGELARGTPHADLWVYDPVADAWEGRASMPAARWQHAMVVLDGVLYVVGGVVAGDGAEASHEAGLWAYDIARDEWRTGLAPLPTPRDHLAALAVDGRILVAGGRNGPNLATVEIYDPARDAWQSGPDLGTPRSGFTMALLEDGVHVVGGEDFTTRATIGTHELLDPATLTWSILADLPTPRHGLASGVLDGRWHVVGGGPRVGLSTTVRVDVWSVAP